MISIAIVISFLCILLVRSWFLSVFSPLLRRGSREYSIAYIAQKPFRELFQTFRNANLDIKKDGFSISKIVVLHIGLLGISAVNLTNVSLFSQILILLYLSFLVLEVFQYRFVYRLVEYNSKHLVIATVMLSSVACILSLILNLTEQGASFPSRFLVSLYCFVVLVTGLGLRNSILPKDQTYGFYQKFEIEFSRFTWLCIFVALFSPEEMDRFSLGSSFLLRVLVLDLAFLFVENLIPKLNTDLRWSIIFKLAIPITLASVFGVFVSIVYVQ